MKFLFLIIVIAVLSAVAENFLPWWGMAIISFLVAMSAGLKAGRAFIAGFLGVALCWLVIALWHDVPNGHILSSRMARLFHLPGYGLFIVVTVFVGGLIGGLSALTGSLLRRN